MAQGFFEKFNYELMKKLTEFGDTYQAQFAEDVMTLAVGAITLFVIWKGYHTMAGKSQTPISDLTWDLAKFGIIIAFITNSDGYLTAATDALQGMKDGVSGSDSVWKTLDNVWLSTQNLADNVYQKDTDFVPMAGAIGMILTWIGAIILVAVASIVFIAADVTMVLLTITAPIFIFCLMFGFLRSMFNNWLQLMFSSILTVLFASLVIRFAIDFQGEMAEQMLKGAVNSNIVTTGAMGLMTGFLAGLLVFISSKIATSLAGAGVDGAVQGMAMMGGFGALKTSNAAGGSGLKAGAGLGYGLTGKKAMQSTVSGQAGNLVGRGINAAGNKASDALASSGALGAQAKRMAVISQARMRNAA